MENKIVLVVSIVNSGYSEKVMELGKTIGVRGGTIFNAAGSVAVDAEKLYGISINPEKEVVLILVLKELADKLLKAVYENLGSNTPAQGIAFTLPVDESSTNIQNQYKKN